MRDLLAKATALAQRDTLRALFRLQDGWEPSCPSEAARLANMLRMHGVSALALIGVHITSEALEELCVSLEESRELYLYGFNYEEIGCDYEDFDEDALPL